MLPTNISKQNPRNKKELDGGHGDDAEPQSTEYVIFILSSPMFKTVLEPS